MSQDIETSTVTVKGQIVIPSRMRKRLRLKKGTKVCLVDRGDELVIRALTGEYFEKMAGALKTGGRLTKRLLADRNRDRHAEDAK